MAQWSRVPWQAICAYRCPKGCSWTAEPISKEALTTLESVGHFCGYCIEPMKRMKI